MKSFIYLIILAISIEVMGQTRKNNFLNDLIIFDKITVKNILTYDDSLDVCSMSGYRTFRQFDSLKVSSDVDFRTRFLLSKSGHIELFSLVVPLVNYSNGYQYKERYDGCAVLFRKNLRQEYSILTRSDLKIFENDYNVFVIKDSRINSRKVYSDQKILIEIIEYTYNLEGQIIREVHFEVLQGENTTNLFKREDWVRKYLYSKNGDLISVNLVYKDFYDDRFLVGNEIGNDDVNELIFRKYQTLKIEYLKNQTKVTNDKQTINFIKVNDEWTEIRSSKGNYNMVLNNPLKEKHTRKLFTENEINDILLRINLEKNTLGE